MSFRTLKSDDEDWIAVGIQRVKVSKPDPIRVPITHADIATQAGTSRIRVTAITNSTTHGVSTDVLIRVLAATGHRAEIRVKKAAA